MDRRATARLRCLAVVGTTLATLGCWNLRGLDDPFFELLGAGNRVWTGVISINPLPSSSEMELDPALLGAWNEVGEEPATWTFEAASGERYRLLIGAHGSVAALEGTFHQVGPNVFLGLASRPFPVSSSSTEPGDGDSVRFHAFFKLIVEDDVARLEGVDQAWTWEMIETGQLDIDHNPDSEDLLLLTASDVEIAAFLERFADDPAMFGVANGFELRCSTARACEVSP